MVRAGARTRENRDRAAPKDGGKKMQIQKKGTDGAGEERERQPGQRTGKERLICRGLWGSRGITFCYTVWRELSILIVFIYFKFSFSLMFIGPVFSPNNLADDIFKTLWQTKKLHIRGNFFYCHNIINDIWMQT